MFDDTSETSIEAGKRDRILFPADDATNPSRIVSARGTEEGLVLRIDGRQDWSVILKELTQFLGDRRKFLEGGHVSIEWLDRLPTKEQSSQLECFLKENFSIEIISRRNKNRSKQKQEFSVYPGSNTNSTKTDTSEVTANSSTLSGELKKVDHEKSTSLAAFFNLPKQGELQLNTQQNGPQSKSTSRLASDLVESDFDRNQLKRINELLGEEPLLDMEGNARLFFGTLRSGQRLETPHSLVVIGDVNPGADLIAGGDIIVFGSLRGTAHAAAYDDENREALIVALSMQPMQLRIGSVISRGNGEHGGKAEVARIEDRHIIVETYNPRSLSRKKR